MSLAILPIGLILGLLLKDARRATYTTVAIGVAGLLALAILSASGVDIWWEIETLVLVVCTPLAVLLARLGARLGTGQNRHRAVRTG